jgi:hypothetical protein
MENLRKHAQSVRILGSGHEFFREIGDKKGTLPRDTFQKGKCLQNSDEKLENPTLQSSWTKLICVILNAEHKGL